jgi:hypothetical protein
MMPTRNQIQELVDEPNETLNVEYKTWLDLIGNLEARADLARHLSYCGDQNGILASAGVLFCFTAVSL